MCTNVCSECEHFRYAVFPEGGACVEDDVFTTAPDAEACERFSQPAPMRFQAINHLREAVRLARASRCADELDSWLAQIERE